MDLGRSARAIVVLSAFKFAMIHDGGGRGADPRRPVMVDVSLRTSLVSSIIGAAALSKLLSKSPHAPPILDKLMNAHVLNRLGSSLLPTIEQAMQASRKSRLSAEELLR